MSGLDSSRNSSALALPSIVRFSIALNRKCEKIGEETIANAHKTPMGRAGYAEDFPGAALFFASDASAWITGTCLRVDGGMARQLGL